MADEKPQDASFEKVEAKEAAATEQKQKKRAGIDCV
ncbi:twin arginine translocase protein A [Actinobacillus equuli]|nr:twin arginine translocase protein A [Actinobacillus equuli]